MQMLRCWPGLLALPIVLAVAADADENDVLVIRLVTASNVGTSNRLIHGTANRFANGATTGTAPNRAPDSGAIATASGQAALHLAIVTLMNAGSHIVASGSLYGGSHNLLAYTLPRFGIETTFVNPRDVDAFRAAIRPETRLVFSETLGNPGLDVLDIPRVADVAHEAGLPLLVDSTFTTPYLLRPFDLGADLIFHSATKFLGGHGTSLGGVVVDSGNFNWSNGRYPVIAEPSPAYHGLKFHETFGIYGYLTKLRAETLRDLGAAISPFNAFLLAQGIETLPLRMRAHVRNAERIAEFLEGDARVKRVAYPGLTTSSYKSLADKYLPEGPGAVFCFDLEGDRKSGQRFIEALSLFSHLANVGDAKSLVIHPASTTHRQLSDEELAGAGIGQGTIRLSIGIEDAEDLIWDLQQGLNALGAST